MRKQEMIIVVGKNVTHICQLRRCLKDKGYHSIPCKSAEQVIEEAGIFLSCNSTIRLIIIEPEIFNNVGSDLLDTIINLALDIPWVIASEDNSANLAEIIDKTYKHGGLAQRRQNDELAAILREKGFEVIYN